MGLKGIERRTALTFFQCKKNPDCKPDGNIFTKGNKPLTKRDMDTRSPVLQGGYYQLRSGETICRPTPFYHPITPQSLDQANHILRS